MIYLNNASKTENVPSIGLNLYIPYIIKSAYNRTYFISSKSDLEHEITRDRMIQNLSFLKIFIFRIFTILYN